MRSLADEVPFDIPDSWEWVRLGAVIELQSGQDMTPDKYNDCGKGIPYITGASNIENGNVLINRWTEYGRAFAYCGDVLLTCKGTVGTMAVLQETQVHIARQIMAIRPISELYVPYIQLVLDTLVENLKAAAKSMIPGIAREDVLQSLFPVPPVSEQKRIVQKVSELSPWLEQYAAADTKLLSLNTAFPEALKKSILQEAVQGKLVSQDPSDEPAEALLERIRAEKQRLIREGKIKKDKHESVIFRRDNSHYEKLDGVERCIDDELPFEIPENWCWARLGSISSYAETKQKVNAANADSAIWGLDLEDIEKGGRLIVRKTVGERKAIGDKTVFSKGDILYRKLRPYLLKILVAPECGICTPEIVPFQVYGGIVSEYIVNFLRSPYVDNLINSITYRVIGESVYQWNATVFSFMIQGEYTIRSAARQSHSRGRHETAKNHYDISAPEGSVSAPAGSSTAMVVPLSELSSTRTQPPWRLVISHTRESPSPAPPYSRLRDLSTRKKGWKMLRRYSSGMP